MDSRSSGESDSSPPRDPRSTASWIGPALRTGDVLIAAGRALGGEIGALRIHEA